VICILPEVLEMDRATQAEKETASALWTNDFGHKTLQPCSSSKTRCPLTTKGSHPCLHRNHSPEIGTNGYKWKVACSETLDSSAGLCACHAFYCFNLQKIIPARTSEGNLDVYHHAPLCTRWQSRNQIGCCYWQKMRGAVIMKGRCCSRLVSWVSPGLRRTNELGETDLLSRFTGKRPWRSARLGDLICFSCKIQQSNHQNKEFAHNLQTWDPHRLKATPW